MITLESPMQIDEAANKVTFDCWTWGQPVKTLSKPGADRWRFLR
jgi:hypothetical protein